MGRPASFFEEYIVIGLLNQRPNQRQITTKSLFFKGEIQAKVHDDKICFLKPSFLNNSKYHKTTFCSNGWYKFSLVCDAPIGKYKIDEEESTEDCKVIYFKN